jgi:nicotinamidase-related amidase
MTNDRIGVVVIDMQYCSLMDRDGNARYARFDEQVDAIRSVLGYAERSDLPMVLVELGKPAKIENKFDRGRTIEQLQDFGYIETCYKTTDSAFASDSFRGVLREKGIGKLIVAGINASWCVRATVRDAFHEGIPVMTSPDLINDFNPSWLDVDEGFYRKFSNFQSDHREVMVKLGERSF